DVQRNRDTGERIQPGGDAELHRGPDQHNLRPEPDVGDSRWHQPDQFASDGDVDERRAFDSDPDSTAITAADRAVHERSGDDGDGVYCAEAKDEARLGGGDAPGVCRSRLRRWTPQAGDGNAHADGDVGRSDPYNQRSADDSIVATRIAKQEAGPPRRGGPA